MYNRTNVFAAACASLLLFGMTLITLGSILPTLIDKYESIGLNKSNLVALLPIGILIGSLVFGPIVDRYGYKLVLIMSILISALALSGLGIAQSPVALYVCILFIGIGGGVINGSTGALVVDISSEYKGASLSLLGVFYGIGAFCMPLLLGILSKTFTYSQILIGVSVCMIFPVLYTLIIAFPSPKQPQGFPVKEGLALLKKPMLLLLSFYLFFQSGVESLSNNFSTSFLQEKISISNEQALYLLSTSVVGLSLSRLGFGLLLKKMSSFTVWISSLIIILVGCFLMYTISSYPMAFPAIFLIGFGLGVGFPIVLGYIGQLFPSLSGTAFSITFVIALTGNTIINYSFGEISKSIGVSKLPIAICVYTLIMLVFSLFAKNFLSKKIK